jgi:hypothetical protein
MLKRFGVATMVAASIGVLALAPAMANGKPTASSGESKIVLNQSDPYLGEWVTFTATYPGTVKNPRIVVNCYQNEALVWGEVGLVSGSFKLGGDSSPWLDNKGGPATCYADLDDLTWHGHNMQEWVELAGVEFDVAG